MNRLPTCTPAAQANAATLEREIAWFSEVLEARFTHYFSQPGTPFGFPAPPDLAGDVSDYAAAVHEWTLCADERLVLMLALMPHLRPQALDLFFTQNKLQGQRFTEFGGWKGKTHEGFLPTCETAAFILAGDDLARRFAVLALFDESHPFSRLRVLRLEHAASGEPQLGAMLIVSPEYLRRFTTGERHKPDFNSSFPAKLITTSLARDKLVLSPEARFEVGHIDVWLRQSNTLLREWGLDKAVKPGYRCLFYGPPGTGKTLV
ncbi:MAG: ATP-binding protein, partial [Gammaproteobacteria bacterium]